MKDLVAAVEAVIYAADEPVTAAQAAAVLGVDRTEILEAISQLAGRYSSDAFGIEIRAVAGGFRFASKPQHHDAVRRFIKSLKPPVKLSLAALETLAVIAYRQPVTVPEIKDIRGVDPGGVINTLLDKKLITTAGRKEVIGKPILYKTTKEFLTRFGLNGVNDLPTLKEFEEMTRAGLDGVELEPETAEETAARAAAAPSDTEANPEGAAPEDSIAEATAETAGAEADDSAQSSEDAPQSVAPPRDMEEPSEPVETGEVGEGNSAVPVPDDAAEDAAADENASDSAANSDAADTDASDNDPADCDAATDGESSPPPSAVVEPSTP